jgi:enoyl-CoA hydratase
VTVSDTSTPDGGFSLIDYERRGALALITLNRPDKLNAINADMVGEIGGALDIAEADDNVRVIVLAGAGRAFSAGFDLETGDAATDTEAVRRTLTKDFGIIMRFWDCPKPTVAAVHRYCLGSALEMAVACDVTLAADDCLFGEPEVQFGSGIVAMLLPWLIGPKQAKELLLTGDDRIPAERALQLGLVNRVVPAARLLDEALDLGRRIAANDQVAVRLTKLAVNRSMDVAGLRQALLQALELDVIIETTQTPESRAFNEILNREGAKAAVDWRRARSGATDKPAGSKP